MTNPMSLIINYFVDGAYMLGFGNEILMGVLLLAFFGYIAVRAHFDRGALALVGALAIGIFVWAGWMELWLWGILLLIGGIVVGYALIRTGGETQ